MRLLAVLGLSLSFSLLLAACSDRVPAGASEGSDMTIAASEHHERGRAVYNFRCYFCHGYSGDARTLASTYLDPRPRDFAAMSAGEMSREQMLDAVTNGREATAMKGFSDILTLEEIGQVVDFIHQEFVIAKARNTSSNAADSAWPYREGYAAAFPYVNDKVSPPQLSQPPIAIQFDDWPESDLTGNPLPLPSIPEVGKGPPRHPN